MSRHQHTSPYLVRPGEARRLQRVPFTERQVDEGWLQQLLFEHPDLIPASEIEPIFRELIPVCRELPVKGGSLDLLYMTDEGNLALVETKLWRNPEARRSVVAQIIDYTKEIARWSYSELRDAVRKSRHLPPDVASAADPLAALASEESEDFNEQQFHDRLSRNLRLGRFLLLIIGDGIREDVEHMAEFLQQTPQFGYTLGLVEIGLYRLNAGRHDELYVQPRIVARTREVVRAVVEIRNKAGDQIETEVTLPPPDETSGGGVRVTLTEKDFLDQLGKNASPEVVEFAKWVLAEVEKQNRGLIIDWGGGGALVKYVHSDSNDSFTFAQLHREGILSGLHWLPRMCQKLGLPDAIWDQYLKRVESLLPGSKRYDDGSYGRKQFHRFDVRMGPRMKIDRPRLELLATNKEAWFDAIGEAVRAIQEAMGERDE